ncbi:MAG: thiamine-phosphate kinase [Hyphomicrobiaceae bacterium]|nr:thiamine-phosphate kinase [Hyphomicrobiaceae bacterium]
MSEQDSIAGEDSLIQSYFAPLAAGFAGAFGLGDDCAALSPEPGHDIVLTTDAIAEGVHFRARDLPEDIAWKAVAVNVSDLAAKAARPIGYLLSLAFPQTPDRKWLERFTDGLRAAQERFGIVLMGGDTDRRPNAPLSVTVMAIGSVPSGRMVLRGTARPDDLLYITGTLGDSALGLHLLSDAGLAIASLDRAFLQQRYLRPEPRIGMRDALLARARAAMDISDGLVKDLGRLCRASAVAAEVHAGSVPVSQPAQRLIESEPELRHLPLTGGDDYEILACIAPEHAAAFESAARSAGIPVTRIGSLREGSGVRVLGLDGQPLEIARPGYDHFQR